MKKKVLILSLGRIGGSVNYAREIIDELKCDKKVFISSFSKEMAPKDFSSIITYKNSFSFLLSSIVVLPSFLIYLLYLQLINKYTNIYFPYFHYWNYPIIFVFKIFFKKVKIISTVHDGISHFGDGKPLEEKLNFLCIKKSDKIIFLTNHVQSNIQKKINYNIDSVVIPHGLIVPIGIKTEIRKHNTKMNILFLGRISKYKGVELLVEAIEKIDDRLYNKLVIAGYQQYSLNVTPSNNLEIINKYLSESEMSSIINKSDLLVLPYLEATQSGVITIGIAASLPMIISKVGGLEEQVNEKEAIWINTNSVNELEKAILSIIKNRNQYELVSENLKKKQKELSWKKIANKLLDQF